MNERLRDWFQKGSLYQRILESQPATESEFARAYAALDSEEPVILMEACALLLVHDSKTLHERVVLGVEKLRGSEVPLVDNLLLAMAAVPPSELDRFPSLRQFVFEAAEKAEHVMNGTFALERLASHGDVSAATVLQRLKRRIIEEEQQKRAQN